MNALERLARRYGPGMSRRKLALLAMLADARLGSAAQLRRLHEWLCFADAYPDDRRIRGRARRMLRAFSHRPDLRGYRGALAGTGIAGTDIPYRFFWPTAHWIVQQWPGALELDRDDAEAVREILVALPSLLEPVQADWLRSHAADDLGALDRLRPPDTTDADYLIGLIARMPGDSFSREAFADRMDLSYRLRAGRGTPERTTSRLDLTAVHYQTSALRHERPDLRAEARRGPSRVRVLRGQRAQSAIRLARISMITRERDLAAFQFAHPGDVFLVDDGRGLAFAMMGMIPSRRAILPATYTALTLHNGVPIGYVQADVLARHAALSFNTFETFRGADAAWVLARFIAAAHHLFGCTDFSVEPYQLGLNNAEGIESGAWWFYHRLGFRPRSVAARRLAAREVARRAARPAYRSSPATLRTIARWHLFYSLDPARKARLPRIGHWLDAAIDVLRRYREADPRESRRVVAAAWRRLGSTRAVPGTAALHEAFSRWAPLVLAWTAQGRWSVPERRELLWLIVAKAGRSERDFQRRLLRHARLRTLLDC